MEKIKRPRCIRNFKKEKVPLESDEQIELFKWKDRMVKKGFKELWGLNASMNGVRLPMGLAKKVKTLGLSPGFPDINLPVGRELNGEIYLGLYIELKRIKGGVISEDQKIWADYLIQHGYSHSFCLGWKHAATIICTYLGIHLEAISI